MAREFLRRWAWTVVVAGLLIMAWAGMRAARYRPGWFDSDDGPPCSSTPDGCPADLDAALNALGWWVGAGGVVVLVGVGLTVWRLPTAAVRQPGARLPAPVHAVIAGTAGAMLAVLGGLPLLIAVLTGPHAVPSVAAAFWLVQAAATAAFDRAFGVPGTSPRRSWVIGLVASAGAMGAAVVAVVLDAGVVDAWWTYALLDGAVLGGTVLAARLAPVLPTGEPQGPPGSASRRSPATVVVVVLVVLSTLAVVQAVRAVPRPAWPPVASLLPAPSPSLPSPLPEQPSPLDRPSPIPTPEPPAVVEAAVPCAPVDVSFSVTGFDAAMGARAASLEATNVGTAPCWVEGTPVVTLLQGGRPLQLTVEPGVSPAEVQRVGVAPGGSAFALLTWRTYAGWADAETPQTVTAALDPASPAVDVPLIAPYGPAPFDIADGGTWGIAPWAPPGN